MKSRLWFFLIPVLCICIIFGTACSVSTSKSFTFSVETGDSIKVELDTSTGLDLSASGGTFAVTSGEDNILNGLFVTEEMRQEYINAVNQENATILKDTPEDFVWTIDGEAGVEYNRIMAIPNAELYALIGSIAGQEAADEALTHLKIEPEEV